MKKKLPLCIIIFLCAIQIGLSQNFRLLGTREFNTDWDVPEVLDFYQADDGSIYYYVDDALTVNGISTSELVRFNPSIADWEDLTNDTFITPLSTPGVGGVGQPDGSVIAVLSGSNEDPRILSYSLSPDGSFEPFGPNEGLVTSNNPEEFVFTRVAQSTSGNIYASVGIGSISVFMFDGTEWTQIPTGGINTQLADISIAVDQDDNLFVLGRQFDTGNGRIFRYDGTEWIQVFGGGFGFDGTLHIVSPEEIYFAFGGNGGVQVALYDGQGQGNNEGVSLIGNLIPVTANGVGLHSDILNASNGDLFLATGNEDGFYRLNTETDTWESFENDVADGGPISGFDPMLTEIDGFIYNAFIDNSVTNQGGVTTVVFNQSVLSVEDQQEDTSDFTISPNPSEGLVQVVLPRNLDQSRIAVYDITGRSVYQEEVQSQSPSTTMNLETLSRGVYIVNLMSQNNQILETRKLIIR
ncbi:T9SS type A sorting domain-containing protein [uncultured Dokdonia sp.]|uniref:T9SS type A sorting domain-containing protein n=1 Tax=uncultured Dokdonia sp. TaxID=575653 RepID=UPI00263518EA|nr:T9SS type A sorting domain-containing protein [uncultured Dokdonia sp.]